MLPASSERRREPRPRGKTLELCRAVWNGRRLLFEGAEVSRKSKSFVPDWAKDAIWYQVFPERFRNGCPASNPRVTDMTDRKIPGWKISPWGMDWYRQERWEKPLGDFFKSVYYRRYGGDLIGLREKLDYLQDLGVTAIYLNPVFHAPSLHKYDATSLHHIDPTLGPDREGDLRALARAKETEDPSTWIWTRADQYFVDLVKEIHRRGMKVILDGVFNHTGQRFFAFEDLKKRGRRSRYRDWYLIKKWNDDGTFEYDGWFGHKMLPEFGRTQSNLVKPVRDYLFNITRRWMDPDGDGDPSDGIDGWRLDVAFCVPHAFWRQWRRLVKGINPAAYTTAEIVSLAREYLRGDEFDAVMNYMWLFPTFSFFQPGPRAMSAPVFRKQLDALRRAYPPDVTQVLQNLLDSHDVGRIATMFENAAGPVKDFGAHFDRARVYHHRDFVTTRPGPRVWDALRQAVIFQMTYVGAPMIYYGTEVGMWGANDPCDRQPMLWDDVRYEREERTCKGRTRKRLREPDKDLFEFYRRAIQLRQAHAVLRRGRFRWLGGGSSRLLAFARCEGREEIRVVLNASDTAARWKINCRALDLWGGGGVVEPGSMKIEPRGWRVLQCLSSRTSRRSR
jgi:glycosidase